MLERANRVTTPSEFRRTVRRGRRVTSGSAVVYVFDRVSSEPSRFGFIVTKAVGNAVTRNLVRRRLRSIGREVLPNIGPGMDIVIRALPGSPEVAWVTLQEEMTESIGRGVGTLGRGVGTQ